MSLFIRGVCVFIPSPVRVATLLMEVPGNPIGASFFEFELKPTGKDSAMCYTRNKIYMIWVFGHMKDGFSTKLLGLGFEPPF